MKIYTTPKAPYQVQLTISQLSLEKEHLSLIDTTIEEVREMLKTLIEKQNLSPFIGGKVTSIVIREYLPYPVSKLGAQAALSFRGLTPKETLTLIITHLKTKKENGN